MTQLKLPDHVLLRLNSSVRIIDRRTGGERSFSLPVASRVVEKRSVARYLGALASAVFAIYFASIFLEGLFTSATEIALLPVIMAIPFIFDGLLGGRTAVVAYLAAFFTLAILGGGLASGSLRLGLIFFGGGPADYQSYAIVPASDLLVALALGLLPYMVMKMVGQVSVLYGIVIGGEGDGYTIWVRHRGFLEETLVFLKAVGNTGPAKPQKLDDTSI